MLSDYSWMDQRLNDLRSEAASLRLARDTRRRRVSVRRVRNIRRTI